MNSQSDPAPGTKDDLGAEVRQSLVLLTISVGVTALVTVAAQAAASLLG